MLYLVVCLPAHNEKRAVNHFEFSVLQLRTDVVLEIQSAGPTKRQGADGRVLLKISCFVAMENDVIIPVYEAVHDNMVAKKPGPFGDEVPHLFQRGCPKLNGWIAIASVTVEGVTAVRCYVSIEGFVARQGHCLPKNRDRYRLPLEE